MKYETIKFEREDGFAVITLNRPHRLNALSIPLLDELCDAQNEIFKDKDLKAYIITGAPRQDGRPCFSAGVDLKDGAQGNKQWEYPGFRGPLYVEQDHIFPENTCAGRLWAKRPQLTSPLLTNMIWSPKISIAAIDGVATAGGLELALACDIILVSETAKITDSHVKNLHSGIGAGSVTTSMVRRVGYSKALEILMLGEFMDGKEAHRIGLANRCYAPDQLLAGAKEMAKKIAGMDFAAVAVTKLSCREVFDWNLNQVWDHSQEHLKWQFFDPTKDLSLLSAIQEWDQRKK
ncbi:MAG: enoyl-CoA hydratase/isomerase family protein [Dehalococcoidia bacterium]